MNWEEWVLGKYMDQNKSLNMIPGGFAGLKSFSSQTKNSYSGTDKSVVRGQDSLFYFANQSRRGIPNPMIEKLWRDDSYYAKVIGNRDSTVSQDDLRKIRKMAHEGHQLDSIGQHFGIVNIKRIKSIL